MTQPLTLIVIAASLFVPFLSIGSPPELRTWTNRSGQELQAKLLAVEQASVRLVSSEGKIITYPIAHLSLEDHVYLQWHQHQGKRHLASR
ncbi:MAG: SHD1 domain-containing protein [Verrucomicrobiota bacterium]